MTDQLSDHLNTLSEMVTGKLLGDGSLTIEEKRKPRLRFGHSIKDREWCLYCFQNYHLFFQKIVPKSKEYTQLLYTYD